MSLKAVFDETDAATVQLYPSASERRGSHLKGFEYFDLKVIEKRIRERLAKSVRGETDAATVRRKLNYLYGVENTGFRRKYRVQEETDAGPFFFFFFTLVTGPRGSLSLELSDARVYEPQIRARLGTTPPS